MNSKGFTLIELLAVIIILMGISLVAVSAISSSLNKRENKECEEQKIIAQNAAKLYFALNSDKDPSLGVRIIDLIGTGFLTEPGKNNRLDCDGLVKIINGKYVYDGDCVEPYSGICSN